MILAGVSLSLSGEFRLQGQEALNGLRLWVDHVERNGGIALAPSGPRLPLRLIALDDASRTEPAKNNVRRLLTEDRVDLLLGPYSSKLTLAVAPIAEAHGKILWNHGGSSDAIWAQGWRHLVSVPSPASDYFRALPLLTRRRDPEVCRLSVVHAKTGSFAAHVTRGLGEAAKAARFDVIHLIPFDSPARDPRALLEEALAADPHALVGVGSFEDDVALVRQRKLLSSVKTLACVGAGVDAFYRELGDSTEGVIGSSQWEPAVHDDPLTGPDSEWFCSEFQRTFGQRPGYPAAQAYAVGVIVVECLRRAETVENDALLQAAHTLATTTLYGRFRLDPMTSRQIAHRVHLVQWRSGRKVTLDEEVRR